MKKYFLALVTIACLITSCSQNNSSSQNNAGSQNTKSPDTATQECYSYTKNRDTVTLTLNRTGDNISGELNYNLFEKDRNRGSIAGKMHGDTLFADYTFLSEGLSSIRQVAFLKKENQLIEGFGDVEEKNDKMIFKNPSTVKFSNSITLTKTDCSQL